MESHQLRHFLAAYDCGTFASAAQRLNISQQAISKSILRLEASLGARLFERDGRRLRPTIYADLLLPRARTIAAEVDRFRAGLSDLLGGRQGELSIGVGPSAAADIVADAVRGVLANRPGVRLKVMAGIQQMMVDDLLFGRLDAFVAIRQVERPDPLVREDVLGRVRYVVAAGADHPLAGVKGLSIRDLDGARWVSGSHLGAVEEQVEASFRASGYGLPEAEVETTSVLFALDMLAGGRHLAILPEMLISSATASGRLVALDLDTRGWSRPLILATRARSQRTPLLDTLIAALVEATRPIRA